MSSIFKGVRKVFKKIVKVVKKIAVPALAVAALVFTGGAALNLTGALSGGWGSAAATISSSLGATGVVGSALTGAITQAGYGALIGGTVSSLSGGSFTEGAKRGAAGGAITGGLMGAYSGVRNAASAANAGGGVTIDSTGKIIEGGAKTYAMPDPVQVAAPQAIDASGNLIQSAAAKATGGTGLLSKVGGWMERNPELAGGIVKGLGTGLAASAGQDDELALMRENQRLRGLNYEGTNPGETYRSASPGESRETPTQRFDPGKYGSIEYVYDPAQGRIVSQRIGG